jgi:hypothetical protein
MARTTRRDLEEALPQLTRALGIPESEGWHLDCYGPDGVTRCVIVNAREWRPLGESRRPMKEMLSTMSFAISAAYAARNHR